MVDLPEVGPGGRRLDVRYVPQQCLATSLGNGSGLLPIDLRQLSWLSFFFFSFPPMILFICGWLPFQFPVML